SQYGPTTGRYKIVRPPSPDSAYPREIQRTTGVRVVSSVARVIRNETACGGTPARSAPGVVAAHEAPPSWENATNTCVPCGPDVFRSTRPQVAKSAGRNGSVTSTAEGAKCWKSIEMSCRTGAAGLGVKRRARYCMYEPAGDTRSEEHTSELQSRFDLV